mmetsp:Transcript_70230/g.228332  ORF Transcript_70230/g.228332 Transcript_70230/m.228332 type:complete len:209 (-) Transcript_70230:321-947(-)
MPPQQRDFDPIGRGRRPEEVAEHLAIRELVAGITVRQQALHARRQPRLRLQDDLDIQHSPRTFRIHDMPLAAAGAGDVQPQGRRGRARPKPPRRRFLLRRPLIRTPICGTTAFLWLPRAVALRPLPPEARRPPSQGRLALPSFLGLLPRIPLLLARCGPPALRPSLFSGMGPARIDPGSGSFPLSLHQQKHRLGMRLVLGRLLVGMQL